ncbi:hypothetical protein ACM66B_006085 [Microbotryomycetes sp. NB124-2]
MAPSSQSQAHASLHLVQSRRSTYHKSRKGSQRALNWPFAVTGSQANSSTIHPDKLAHNGLYSTPTTESPTCSTCFACGAVVDKLDEGDDPIEKHAQALLAQHDTHTRACGWLTLKRIQQLWPEGLVDGTHADNDKDWDKVLGDEWRQPHSDRMLQARLDTFKHGWPHEKTKGVPPKEQIAAAGWFFRPGTGDAVDNCLCPFCTRTVEGWEAGDDPVALHQRKLGLKCPFFVVPKNTETAAAPPPSKLSRSKARTKLTDINSEAETVAAEPELELAKPTRASRRATSRVPSSPAASQTTVPAKATRATRQSKRTTAAQITPIEVALVESSVIIEDVDQEEQEPVTAAAEADESVIFESARPATRRTGRAAKVSTSSVVVEVPVKGRKGARKTVQKDETEEGETAVDEQEQAQVAVRVTEEEEVASAAAPAAKKKKASAVTKKKAATKSKRAATAAQLEEAVHEVEEADLEAQDSLETPVNEREAQKSVAEAEAPSKLKSSSSSSALTKSKSKISKTKSSKKTAAAAVTPILVDVDVEDSFAQQRLSSDKSIQRPPLTPTSASNAPLSTRPDVATAATDKQVDDGFSTNATLSSKSQDPLVEPFISQTNPSTLFPQTSTSLLNDLTSSELDLTITQFYDQVGRQTYDALNEALQREYDGFEKRVQQGRERLLDMIKVAREQELA